VGRRGARRQASRRRQRRVPALLLRAGGPAAAAGGARRVAAGPVRAGAGGQQGHLRRPGALVSRPCLFLDRDGVINVKPPEGEYVRRWEEFQLIPAAVDWIRLFNAAGFLVVVVTNQRGVALGLMTLADVADIHARMTAELA